MERPKLRAVECHAVRDGGRRAFLLHDPAGYAAAPLVVSPQVVFLLQHFDGSHALDDIAERFRRATGQVVPRERLEELVRSLDEARFLDSEAFRRHLEERLAAYRALPARPAAHGGDAYPTDPAELAAWYEGLDAGPLEGRLPEGTIVGAAAPHIDVRFGGGSCRLVHEALRDRAPDADTLVVLGTGHAAGDALYTLTRLPFETPLGLVETDAEFVDALARRAGGAALFEQELLHASEHSVEFQALFLRLARRSGGPRIVPVLCGSFHDFVQSGTEPLEDGRVASFVEGFAEAAADLGRRVLVVASIDLSHVGPRYGDARGPDEEERRRIEREDRALLAFAERGDAEGFFRHNQERGDARRVCGFSALYTLLRLLPGARGTLLRYEQTTFPGTEDTVAHCALLFEEGSAE